MKPDETALNPKQEAFCQEYLKDLNATQAAIRAGYSEDSAGSIGHENLKKPEISARVQQLMNERSERTKITADRVLKELAKIAFSDMRKFAKWGPGGVSLIDCSTLADEDAACVAEASESTSKDGGSIRFKLHDKKGALELLGKHLKLFTEKHEHSGPEGKAIPIATQTTEELQARLAELLAKVKPNDPGPEQT